MPRRKQNQPKRMKWEEGDPKEDDQTTDKSVEASPSSSRSANNSPDEVQSSSAGDMAEICVDQAPASLDDHKSIKEELESEDEDEPMDENAPIDFSLKKASHEEELEIKRENDSPVENGTSAGNQDSPLDLSMGKPKSEEGKGKKRSHQGSGSENNSKKPYNSLFKFIDDSHQWNGKTKIKQEKTLTANANALNSLNNSQYSLLHSKLYAGRDKITPSKSENSRHNNRQNPWQTQWITRSSEQTKDVFTCVWCKDSFRSLAEMTYHMKQSVRCGMAGIQASVPPTSPSPTSTLPPQSHSSSNSIKSSTQAGSTGSNSNSNLLIKESMPLPRKLVRGQDVWLGKGAEQTRQILKCMWCGQSFKTLADMTTHMRVTQHYTNIISQEQIISWRSPEDKLSAQSQVNAVLTCKVCDQAFGSLKELSTHMEKNSHYKEHILRSITEGGGRRRQTRERRKKSLPVRKLLEIERMETNKGCRSRHENGDSSRSEIVDGKITCEECAEKVDAKDFVQHIKNCNHGSKSQSYIKAENSESCDSKDDQDDGALSQNEEPTTSNNNSNNNNNNPAAKSPDAYSNLPSPKLEEKVAENNSEKNDSSSVINALEKLIEKSFESKGRRHATTKGILQRLGIDEEVCPPWYPSNSPSKLPLMKNHSDFNFKPSSPLRNYSQNSDYREESSRRSPLVHSSYHFNEDALGSGRSRVSTPSSLTSPSIPSSPSPQLETFKEKSPQVTKSPFSPGSPHPMPDLSNIKQTDKNCDDSNSGVPEDLRSSPLQRPQSAETRTDNNSPPHLEPEDDVSTTNECHDDDSSLPESPEPRAEPPKTKATSTKRKNSQDPPDHPLKQLQKLLDKTDAHLTRPGMPSNPGSILAFSWACNDATTSDSLMKCAFCETHFVSKGAYRHHLSKMHFVKDGSAEKNSGESTTSWRCPSENSPKDSPNSSTAPPQGESPHSKFLKYTELAKQLSSKYV